MKLDRYLFETKTKPAEFARTLGVSREAVRLYIKGDRLPRRDIMERIVRETDGEVTANDFYEVAA